MQSFKEHNDEVKEVWKTYREGNPVRVPMILIFSARGFLSDPDLNTEKISYFDYHNNADVMLDVQLKVKDYVKHNIYADHEMGIPDEWNISIDGGNFHHSAWFGSKIHYSNIDSPDTIPLLNDDNKNMLFDKGILDPFSGIYGQHRDMYEYLYEKLNNFTYKERPVSKKIDVPAAALAGSGLPFTTACKLRGTTEFCMDMVLDPNFAHLLLEYITEAAIKRIEAWRNYLGLPIKTDNVFLGDDSVTLLSPEMYKEFIMPLHKKLYENFGNKDAQRGIHLCGNAAKHFEVMRKELKVKLFDTGFPINLKELYDKLGKDAIIQGGVHVELLRTGKPEDIKTKTKEILNSVKPFKKFILRDANHLAPCTPKGNLRAMYDACRKYGVY